MRPSSTALAISVAKGLAASYVLIEKLPMPPPWWQDTHFAFTSGATSWYQVGACFTDSSCLPEAGSEPSESLQALLKLKTKTSPASLLLGNAMDLPLWCIDTRGRLPRNYGRTAMPDDRPQTSP